MGSPQSLLSQESLPMMDEEKNDKPRSLMRQMLCAFLINCVSFLQGASVSTSSIILYEMQNSSHHNTDDHSHFSNCTGEVQSCQLTADEGLGPFFILNDFHLTQEEGSWIASSWVLGHLVSACFAGFLSDAIGRKKSLLIDTAVFFLGFGLLATGHQMTCLILARLLLGYPLVSQVFLCEILDTDRRGLGAAMYSILHSTGFFSVLFLGAFLPWRLAVSVPMVLALPIFIGLSFLQESPDWLRKKQRFEEMERSISFYRRYRDTECGANCKLCQPSDQEIPEKGKSSVSFAENLLEVSRALLSKSEQFWSRFIFLSALFALIGWCGFPILSFYAVEIFSKSGYPFSASHTSWLTSITKIVCSIGSFYVLHRFDRRRLFLFTSMLVLVAFVSMSVFTLVVDKGWLDESITTQINFIPMVSVIVAYVGYGLGYGVIPSLIAAETMPVDVRSTAVGLFMTVEMLSTFLLSKLKPILMESLQIHGLFAMFSCTVLAVIMLMLVFKPTSSKEVDKTRI